MALAPEQCAQEFARLLNAQPEVCRQILDKSRLQPSMCEERNEEQLHTLIHI